jgi:NAD(P)H-quinone oxidoreductase subunit 4
LTFDLTQLGLKDYSLGFELLMYAGLLIYMALNYQCFRCTLAPRCPWVRASIPVSILILAGVLLKIDGYALIRMNVNAAMLMPISLCFSRVGCG